MKLFYFPFFLFLSISIWAQKSTNLEIATICFQNNEFVKAEEYYQKAIYEVNNNGKCHILEKLSICFEKTQDFENEKKTHTEILKNCLTTNLEIYEYAKVLMKNGEYFTAKKVIERYNKSEPNDSLGLTLYNACDSAITWMEKNKNIYFVESFSYNTEFNEYAPYIIQGHLIFSSNREDILIENKSLRDLTPKHKLYSTEIKDDSKPKKLANYINTPQEDIGALCHHPMTKEIIYTKTSSKHGTETLNLYSTTYPSNSWKKSKQFKFRDSLISCAHPSLSSTGDTLFFVGTKKDNNTDIYWCIRSHDSWLPPEKLPATINTKHEELFPYFYENKLYFSSNGHFGMGGFDLFVSELKNGQWSQPKNLQYPFSSAGDDLGLFKEENSFYISSNRKGGEGLLDIYTIQKKE